MTFRDLLKLLPPENENDRVVGIQRSKGQVVFVAPHTRIVLDNGQATIHAR